MNAGADPFEWYREIPVVSRAYFTLSFLTTAACALELVSPLTLYFNYKLIFEKGQVWRLVSNFLFFGMFSLDFLFHMYFLVRYCRLLEENSFRGRTGDFVAFIVFGMACMTMIAPFVNIPFFGSSLTFMMVYIWGRRNEHVRMSFLGLFPFNAPYLPWVLFTFSLVLGNSATVDLIGIAVGHFYFYFDDIYPKVAEIRGWAPKRYLRLSQYWQPAQDEIRVEANEQLLGGAVAAAADPADAQQFGDAAPADISQRNNALRQGGVADQEERVDRHYAEETVADAPMPMPASSAAAAAAASRAAANSNPLQDREDETIEMRSEAENNLQGSDHVDEHHELSGALSPEESEDFAANGLRQRRQADQGESNET